MEYTNTHTEAAANLHFAERAAAQQRGGVETASHCHNTKFLHNVETLGEGANQAERPRLKKLQLLATSNSVDNDTDFLFAMPEAALSRKPYKRSHPASR